MMKNEYIEKLIGLDRELQKAFGRYVWYVVRDYKESQLRENEVIDVGAASFGCHVEEVKGYMEACRVCGVKRVVISDQSTACSRIVYAFVERGAELKGMTTVNVNRKDVFYDEEFKKDWKDYQPAFVLDLFPSDGSDGEEEGE